MDKKYFSWGTFSDEIEKHRELSRGCKKCIVEIGVLNGETTSVFLQNNSKVKIYGIDPLIPDSMNKKLIGNLESINRLHTLFNNFIFINDYSYNVVKKWEEGISYIFLDGDHRYRSVKRDFEDWLPFVEAGGFISLHDSAANRGGPYWWKGPSKLSDQLIRDKRVEYVDTVCSLTVFRKA